MSLTDIASLAGSALLAVVILVVAMNVAAAERRITSSVDRFTPIGSREFERNFTGIMGVQIAPGNRIETLVNGARIFPAMLEAIESAERSINFETFIYWSGSVGRDFAEALARKARSGVQVNVLLDWIGSQRMEGALLRQITDAGATIHRFHPPTWRNLARMNNRTHRKLLIVDGRIGFTGGVGIADDWLGDADLPTRWRDTHYRVEGPIVRQLQGVFLENWLKASGRLLHGQAYFPALESAGPLEAHVLSSSPAGGAESMHLMIQIAIAAARFEIVVATPYFIPDPLTVAALKTAAARGVRVEILLAGRNIDSWLARRASQSLWDELLDADIVLREYEPARLHWKLMVVDRIWTTVGSMNFDSRSFSLNDESTLNVVDRAFAAEQLEIFARDALRSTAIRRSRWRRRPAMRRLSECVARLARSQV